MLSSTADKLFWMARYTERAENLARMAGELLRDDNIRREQIDSFRAAHDMLAGENPDRPPSVQAADFVLATNGP